MTPGMRRGPLWQFVPGKQTTNPQVIEGAAAGLMDIWIAARIETGWTGYRRVSNPKGEYDPEYDGWHCRAIVEWPAS